MELRIFPVLVILMIIDNFVCRVEKQSILIWLEKTIMKLVKACVQRWNTILIGHGNDI